MSDAQSLPPRDDGRARHMRALAAIGLDSVVDAHAHWFPESVMRKIWSYFDQHYWPIAYRQLPQGRLDWVRRNGISRFTTLNYAHKPGMAAWLNEWTHQFVAKVPEAIPCGTFYPDPDVDEEVGRCIEVYRFQGFKLHLRVSALDPAQESLRSAFAQIEASGLPVVVHSGSAPDPGDFTNPDSIKRLLGHFPALKLVIAHMGGWEWEPYLELAAQCDTLYLDTTMVFTGFSAVDPYPEHLLERLEGLSHRVLFGSDFPNIPYPLTHAIEGVLALPLSDEAKRAIMRDNAVALFGLKSV